MTDDLLDKLAAAPTGHISPSELRARMVAALEGLRDDLRANADKLDAMSPEDAAARIGELVDQARDRAKAELGASLRRRAH
ncbi:hypothetical protein [Methylocystis echinoides]|uniref:Uncharacterized protein n=1 Tax=Methylocystis echinoides TaxID=29468 RepID=A0A9W6GWW1_9HYPH|nr:hypothetical protein [Methylocystis echinoides]GLI94305.1 hypothetical protein LMG27198_32970 [Methylocystis echinoides]